MQHMVKILKALSNKNRLAIFEYLRRHELACDNPGEGHTVGDIARQYDLALSTVSHHLKELKAVGLVTCEQRGQYTYCFANQEKVEELRNFFSSDC